MQQVRTDFSKEDLVELCCRIAVDRRIVCSAASGPLISGYGDAQCDINILLVLHRFAPRLRTYHKPIDDAKAFVLAVDKGAFQKDVSAGWLGETAAEKLLVPYEPLIDSDYLWRQEVTLKKRIMWEMLEALILEFPELSLEMIIEQEFFLHETQMQRAKLLPQIAYRSLNILESGLKERNIESMMNGFKQALEELSQEDWISIKDGLVRITPKLVDTIKARKIRIPVFLRSIQRAALLHIFSALPKMMEPLKIEKEFYTKKHPDFRENGDPALKLESPKDHLLIPTPLGPVSLSDATNIEDFIRKSIPALSASKIESKQIGGVLNSVYLLTLKKDHQVEKVIVKKFGDWAGFKWFPLALWSLGTKSFAVLGKSRLEREYALNQYLSSQGLTVPNILHVSPKQSLVFQEFVEGQTLAEMIKKVFSGNREIQNELDLVRETGRQVAIVHIAGVGLGDCKPENIIVTRDDRLCFVDLEQASRNGDQAWDIAEFLYYSGHYVSPLASADMIELLTKSFIEGYLEAGGRKETIKRAASPRYTKVFSIFTLPHVILAISNLCRKVGSE